MTKRVIKIVVIVLLALMIAFELGYIVKTNILRSRQVPTATTAPTQEPVAETPPIVSGPEPVEKTETVIVLDPGHGKPSAIMSSQEKTNEGWSVNASGKWGDWRHYKIGSSTVHCEGSGCNGRVTPNGACWYAMESSDRNTEPDINLKNALAAKRKLEEMGYKVRLTRSSNDENPSITKRLSYCYPDNDPTKQPDARAFVCIHSNASGGSGRGTAYIKADGVYDQAWIGADYVEASNELGKKCNDKIAELTSLDIHGNGEIAWEPELIAFCKSPIPCGYLEIGFFDNESDLNILNTETEKIGEAIAKGVDEFCKTH